MADLKEKGGKVKSTACVCWVALQVTRRSTADEKGRGGENVLDRPVSWVFPTAAHEPTRRQGL